MRDSDELGISDGGGKPVTRPRPTRELVALVESTIGAGLPPSYVLFLDYSNGRCPGLGTFYVEAGQSHQEWGVDHFFHICSDLDDYRNIMWQYRHRWANAAREILPIADDGSGNLICLDLTESGNGRVVLWVHDEPGQPILRVASSFEEFIDLLTVNPDYI